MTLLEMIQQLFTDGIRITITIEPNDKTYESKCDICGFVARGRNEQATRDALEVQYSQCRRDDCPPVKDMPDWIMKTRQFTTKK